MGRPILVFRNRAWPSAVEDIELLRNNLRRPQDQLLIEKLKRAVTSTDVATVHPSEYQALMAAIQAIRQSGVNLSDNLGKLESELKADVERGVVS